MGRSLAETFLDPDGGGMLFVAWIAYDYGPLGRRTSLSVEIDNTADLVNQYQYDYLSRITRITQSGQTGGNAVAEKRVDFEYDLGTRP